MKISIKTILISDISLPYKGIGSWTTMFNYLLLCDNEIDYIICPKSYVKANNVERRFVKSITIFQKAKNKLDGVSIFNRYINELKILLKSETKVIVQLVDNLGLLKAVSKFIEDEGLRERIYVQFFFHGFSPFNSTEKMFSQIDELILLSNSSYLSFKHNCISLPVKVSISNNGVDSAKFKPVSKKKKEVLREKYIISKEKMIFAWCSQDRKKKGLDIILQSWKYLLNEFPNDIELLVIGTEKDIKLPNVKVIGRIPNNELVEYYQLSDFYLFPTLCHEGFGLSLAEALKCGCYCIASNNGAVPEVLKQGKYGKLIEHPNIIQNWVDEIIKSIKEYKSLNNKNPYQQNIPDKLFDMKNWVDNYNKIIKTAKENFLIRYYL
jgi:glycosyltransferase involved in cell wall biosynthesis